MKLIKTLTVLGSASLVACALPQSAPAALVNLVNPTSLAGLSIAGDTVAISGTLQQSLGPLSFTASTFSGTIASAVYLNGTGDLFEYQLTDSILSPAAITRFTVDGFSGSQTLAVGSLTGSVNAPDSADRLLADNGQQVGFNWSAGLLPGQSATFLIQTTTTHYGVVTVGISEGSATTSMALSVPEPTTMVAGAMLLLPFGASTLRSLRRKSAV